MQKQIVNPRALSPANSTYSQAIKAGGFLFVSGQIGVTPATGKLVSDDIAEQTRQALENTRVVLESAGSSLNNVVSASLFLTEFGELGRVNAVYAQYFQTGGPAKMACGVSALYGGAKIEIQVIAIV
ncbi:MAG TPA: Rid family detoxifying hydrolase [Candidatus Dormibacteraeota bacterium]|nr:Rid family detoxifying hydrolase [Candidatus Dormibacteraeota bacterium]